MLIFQIFLYSEKLLKIVLFIILLNKSIILFTYKIIMKNRLLKNEKKKIKKNKKKTENTKNKNTKKSIFE